MTKLFEIFTTESPLTTKSTAIDTLYGYPNDVTKTEEYRIGEEKYQGTDWCGCVDDILQSTCEPMTPEQRAVYYDDSDLKSMEWLNDNNWFDPGE